MPMSAAAKYELKNPITHRAADLSMMSGTLGPDVLDISHLTRDLGIFTYDPGFMSTASTDGDAGVLLYHGYPVEQLAEHSSYIRSATAAGQLRIAILEKRALQRREDAARLSGINLPKRSGRGRMRTGTCPPPTPSPNPRALSLKTANRCPE